MPHWQVDSDGPETTRALGVCLGALADGDVTIFLDGDLGSGKTCFTQGIAAGLEVPAAEPVTSPTYTLMNQYRGRRDLFHFDLYRLSGAVELEDIGFEELVAAPGIKVVEWARRSISGDRPGLYIHLVHGGDDRRSLIFTARGPVAHALLAALEAAWQARGDAS